MRQYNNGYRKALSDVSQWFRSHGDVLKTLKLYKRGEVEGLLDLFVREADTFRKYGDCTDVYRLKDGTLEVMK